MYEKAEWGLLSRQLASEHHARRDAFSRPHEPTNHGGQIMPIDSGPMSELGRQFADEEKQRSAERHDAGVLPTSTILSLVAALRADLIHRGADNERITASLEQLTRAGWELPADQWLHRAGDTWRDVMHTSAGGSRG